MTKFSDECLVIDINSITECPMCGINITKKNRSNSCKKNIEGHSVCIICYNRLSETYYKNGIGCLYCADPKTKITNQNVTEVPGPIPLINEHLVIIERNNRGGMTWVCNCDVGCNEDQPKESKPDGLILGKALGGGFMPVSCFLTSKEVMQWMDPGSHGSTFGGNPLAAALAKRSLELLVEEDLIENSRAMGDYFKECLLSMNSKIIKEIRGKGLWLGVEIDPNYVSGKELSKMCLEAGILCKETHETTIRYAPPLVITKEELDWGIEKINAVFSKITI